MEMKRHLETLAQKDPDLRRQALADVLDAEGLSYCLQEDGPNFKNPRGTVNYILDPWQDAPSLLFCAHYDAVQEALAPMITPPPSASSLTLQRT